MSVIFFRISAVILGLFAALHTFGFLHFVAPTAAGVSVKEAMDTVMFHAAGANLSYGRFYQGFGLIVTISLAFAAVMAGWAGQLAISSPAQARFLGATLAVYMVASLALCLTYFAAPQAAFSAATLVCLAIAVLTSHMRKANSAG